MKCYIIGSKVGISSLINMAIENNIGVEISDPLEQKANQLNKLKFYKVKSNKKNKK